MAKKTRKNTCPDCEENCGHVERGCCVDMIEEDEFCPDCNEECGYHERGYCIEDECTKCGEWLANCDCEPED